MTKTIIDKLRGKPLVKLSEFATVYKQGTVIGLGILVLISIVTPLIMDILGNLAGVFAIGFILMFATALSVKMELPDGSEI